MSYARPKSAARLELRVTPPGMTRLVIALGLAAFFLRRTWPGLATYFSRDDMMNLYWAWIAPPQRLALANVVPFTTEYRPLGAALYRILFAVFGFHPLPFRIAAYALMLLNVYLLFRFARRLTASVEIGIIAALIGCYHPRLFDLYGNNGTIYDILCYTFYFLALDYYVMHRTAGGLTGWRLLAFAALTIASLNAKEMALTLPAVLLAYELIYRRPSANIQAVWRWVMVAGPALGLAVALAASAFIAKTATGSPMHNHVSYTPVLTARQYFVNTRYLFSDLLDIQGARPGVFGLKSRTAVLLLLGMFAAALLLRRKHLAFSAVFAFLTPIPVMFIPYRGFFVMYLPLAGWAIYVATVAVEGRDYLFQRVLNRPAVSGSAWTPRRIALFLLVGLFFTRRPPSIADRPVAAPQWAQLNQEQHALKQGILACRPGMPKGARILLLRDPYDDSFTPLFLIRLLYRDETLQVEHVARMQPAPELRTYDVVLEYVGERYKTVTTARP